MKNKKFHIEQMLFCCGSTEVIKVEVRDLKEYRDWDFKQKKWVKDILYQVYNPKVGLFGATEEMLYESRDEAQKDMDYTIEMNEFTAMVERCAKIMKEGKWS